MIELVILIFLNVHLLDAKMIIPDESQKPIIYQTALQFNEDWDSLNARFVGNWPFGGSKTLTLDTVRRIAFTGSGGGVYLFDITEPANPQKIGEIRTRGTVYKMSYQDNILGIACNIGEVEIWDVTNPSQPVMLSFVPFHAHSIAVKDSYLYACNTTLEIFNIQNPASPFWLGRCGNYFSGIVDILLKDSFAFIATKGLRIINIQNPANPYEVSALETLGLNGLAELNNYVYGPAYNGLHIIDISNPINPYEVGFCLTQEAVYNVAVLDSYAYVVHYRGLTIINVQNSSNPFVVANCTTTTWSDMVDVGVKDSFAYLADFQSKRGLWVVNIRDKSNPFEAGFYTIPGWSFSVLLENDYAYLVGWDDGLRILNIENPAYPYEIGSFATEHGSQGVAIRDTFAYLCDYGYGKGLRILNISNRTRPIEIGFCVTPGAACAVALRGTYAYIADGTFGLRIINIENPSNPFEVGFCNTPDYAWSIAIQDSLAYIADWRGGLRIINIQNPSNPYEVGSIIISNEPVVIAVIDSLALVGGYMGSMRIINISNPSNPYEIGYYETYGPCFGVYVSYPYAYVSDWFLPGFHVVDFTQPSNPFQVGYYRAPSSAYGLVFSAPYVYVTTGLCGLQIYENLLVGIEEKKSSGLAVKELEIYPNPAKAYFTIHLSKTIDKQQLKIFDVSGKLINIAEKVISVQKHKQEMTISLKGINPGIYFLRLGKETKKFLIVQ